MERPKSLFIYKKKKQASPQANERSSSFGEYILLRQPRNGNYTLLKKHLRQPHLSLRLPMYSGTI